MKLMVDHLIDELRKRFHNIADPRNGSNKQYPFVDIAMAAFSAFSFSRRLFWSINRSFHQANSKNACRSLFGIRKLPTDNHIREQLDRIDCQDVYPGFDIALDQMKKYQALKPFQILDGRSLLALDGSEFPQLLQDSVSTMSHPTSKLWRDRISPYRVVRHIGWHRPQRGAAVAPAVYHAARRGS